MLFFLVASKPPAILRDLEKAIAHLEGVLGSAPWSTRPARSRLEHVVGLLRSDAAQWHRSVGGHHAGGVDSVGLGGTVVARSDADSADLPTGRGVIPVTNGSDARDTRQYCGYPSSRVHQWLLEPLHRHTRHTVASVPVTY